MNCVSMHLHTSSDGAVQGCTAAVCEGGLWGVSVSHCMSMLHLKQPTRHGVGSPVSAERCPPSSRVWWSWNRTGQSGLSKEVSSKWLPLSPSPSPVLLTRTQQRCEVARQAEVKCDKVQSHPCVGCVAAGNQLQTILQSGGQVVHAH